MTGLPPRPYCPRPGEAIQLPSDGVLRIAQDPEVLAQLRDGLGVGRSLPPDVFPWKVRNNKLDGDVGYKLQQTNQGDISMVAPRRWDGQPCQGVIISCERRPGNTTAAVGAVVQVLVGVQGAQAGFRRFIVTPDAPAYLALGRYSAVEIGMAAASPAAGTNADPPVYVAWLDEFWIPGEFRLKSDWISVSAGTTFLTPPGSDSVLVDRAGMTITWTTSAQANGGAAFSVATAPTGLSRSVVLGDRYSVDIVGNLQFYLWPL